ncbi:hypothetical protein LY78DRAFT_489625 [Colletotrichum sublineola]|nr:hypothetical protein LY78DRAFT_489625 [Colletotrichum sublineola]
MQEDVDTRNKAPNSLLVFPKHRQFLRLRLLLPEPYREPRYEEKDVMTSLIQRLIFRG